MKVLVVVIVCVLGAETFIIPDEFPSILSVIYSNIPTLKKGTDSRLGWGFRLGDRADFQVMVELGPQKNTQPLANQNQNDDSNGSSSKRNTLNRLADTLYAQRQQDKKIKEQTKTEKYKNKKDKVKETSSTTEANKAGSEWLKTWKGVNDDEPQHKEVPAPTSSPDLGVGEVDAKSVIPDEN